MAVFHRLYEPSEPRIYRIVRFYRNGRRPRTTRTGLTLTEAQNHCNDPKTRREGVYFDGYDYMKGCRPAAGE